jgi:aryl-alcohol dehydrogenase-like predicted oxidoreductase
MKTTPLGSQGLVVSAQGLGCMGMSAFYGGYDDVESVATVHRALELGVTFFDTAESYGPFTNERLLGSALAGHRDEVQLATKFAVEMDDDGTRHGWNGSPAYARRALERSLRNLATDHVDLYYLHRVDPSTPIEETMTGLAELVTEGKTRYVGLSEASAATIRRAHAVHPVTAVQSEYSLFARGPEHDGVLQVCRELGIGFVPYSPLGRGFLTGGLGDATALPGDDWRRTLPWFQPENYAHNRSLADGLAGLAGARGITVSQLALAWVAAQGTVPIPGTKRRRWLEENVSAADIALTVAEVAQLSAAVPHRGTAGERGPAEFLAVTNG